MGQRKVKRLLLRQQTVLFGFQPCDICKRIAAVTQQSGNLRFELCDLALCLRQRLILGLALGNQRRDPASLTRGFVICGFKISGEGCVRITLKAQRRCQRGHFIAERVQFCFLSGNLLAQHKLDHHKDREHEHQHKQKTGHRIDETRPDRILEPV